VLRELGAEVARLTAETGEQAEARSLRTYTLADLCNIESERATWHVPGILAAGQASILHGPPKEGKTTLGLDLAAAVARGDRWWCGRPMSGEPVPVLFATEMSAAAIAQCAKLKVYMPEENLHFLLSNADTRHLRTVEEVAEALGNLAAKLGALVIMLDTLAHWGRVEGEGQENDNALMGHVCRVLRNRLALDRRLALLAFDHSNKSKSQDLIDGLRGASAKAAEVDAVLRLERVGSETDRRRRLRGRGRMDEHAQNVVIELSEAGGFVTASAGAANRNRRILEAIASLSAEDADVQAFGVARIRKEAGVGMKVCREGLADLCQPGGPVENLAGAGYRLVPESSPDPRTPGRPPRGGRPESGGSSEGPDSSETATDWGGLGADSPQESGVASRGADSSQESGVDAPRCPECDGPTRRHGNGKGSQCAGRCAGDAGPGGLVPVVAAGIRRAPAAPAEDQALFDTDPTPDDRDTEGRRPDGKRR
jgi:hypothetical protein